MDTAAGRVPRVDCRLKLRDHCGSWKVRWGIGRSDYMVPPGLYAIGMPGTEDPVVVTANFKMSYDLVRSRLQGRNIWLLVLETFGINVWCAAGKGSFGTEELVRRLEATRLDQVVDHRRLLLPLLGAPGIAAHEVARATGFHVCYAAIRAADLPAFLDNDMTTTADMQKLSFSFYERLVLVPIEALQALRIMLPVAALLFMLAWWSQGMQVGLAAGAGLLGAAATGTIAVPLLLPWLPSRRFAVKGAFAGLLWSLVWLAWVGHDLSWAAAAGSLLALPAISSFYGLNFTGSTPYTSRSGVQQEMRSALPPLAVSLGGAILLWGLALLT